MGIRNHNHHNSQFRRRPLTAAEFVPPLSKIDPIYKEEEDTYRVSVYSVRCAVTMHACCIQGWFDKTPMGKKRLKAIKGDDDDGGGKGKGKEKVVVVVVINLVVLMLGLYDNGVRFYTLSYQIVFVLP